MKTENRKWKIENEIENACLCVLFKLCVCTSHVAPYTAIILMIGPRIQQARVQISPFSHGIAECSDQQVESSGKVCVKNIVEKRGCGNDSFELNLIAQRHTVVTKPIFFCFACTHLHVIIFLQKNIQRIIKNKET